MNRSGLTQTGLVLLLVVSTFCPALHAGFYPEQHVIVQTEADGPRSVYAADLDGDGDLDVLSASSEDDKIAWHRNDGTGRFGPQQVITTEADGANCVYAADLDGDGDLDVLSAFGSTIAWYANDGTGHFGPQQVITTVARYAQSVYAADLDGDGDLDVLSASSEEDKIAWHRNDGTGRFGPQQVITTEADAAWCVYAADLDGDGDLDVLSASLGNDQIAWYANDGKGQFGPQQVITTAASMATCVYAADLDGDGDLDVLSASYTWDEHARPIDGKIAWHANDGIGRFGPQQVISTQVDGANCVCAADLDGDGDLDVLSASSVDDKIAWYANDGTGQFGPQQVISTKARGAQSAYAADLDGDGDLDVISASWNDDKIAWYTNDGTGQFGLQQVITTAVSGARCVYAADLEGDGDLDVLSASSYDEIAWYANDGQGQFGPQQVITTEADGAQSVYAADLDADGDLDVLAASRGVWTESGWTNSRIAWYANDGAGQFGPQQLISTEVVGEESVYVADLDGDGDLDVLAASPGDWTESGYTNSKIAWYANDGRGHFGAQQEIGEGEPPLCVADLDGDGDLDVLSPRSIYYEDGDYFIGYIAWYANDGSGHFGPESVMTSADRAPQSLCVADLDGDGDLDVLAVFLERNEGYCNYTISWYANDGSGHFGPERPIDAWERNDWWRSEFGRSSLDVADLDGDSDLDVLSCGGWYANDGTGHLGPGQGITGAADGATWVCAADLDGDGDLDVLSASWRKIAWYENE